jgi:hypothetical protein
MFHPNRTKTIKLSARIDDYIQLNIDFKYATIEITDFIVSIQQHSHAIINTKIAMA